ncbi:MAG TPA: hypothetical protein VGE04_19370 [Chloroflexia bacterium]
MKEEDKAGAEEIAHIYSPHLAHPEQARDFQMEVSAEPPAEPGKPRLPGLHAHLGPAWASDDFDEPLPDEFWLGEEEE